MCIWHTTNEATACLLTWMKLLNSRSRVLFAWEFRDRPLHPYDWTQEGTKARFVVKPEGVSTTILTKPEGSQLKAEGLKNPERG